MGSFRFLIARVTRLIALLLLATPLGTPAHAGKVDRLTCEVDFGNLAVLEQKVLIEARLRALPPEVASSVREQWKSVVEIAEGSMKDSRADLKGAKIFAPKELLETFVTNSLLLHEIEHLIQLELMRRKDPKAIQKLGTKIFEIPPIRAAMEKGAIGMEGLSYKAVPREVRQQLVREVEEGALKDRLDALERQMLKRILNNSFRQLDDFIRSEQKWRSYTLQEFQAQYQARHWDGLFVGAYSSEEISDAAWKIARVGGETAAVSAATVGSLYFYCGKFKGESATCESQFYRQVCVKLGFQE